MSQSTPARSLELLDFLNANDYNDLFSLALVAVTMTLPCDSFATLFYKRNDC